MIEQNNISKKKYYWLVITTQILFLNVLYVNILKIKILNYLLDKFNITIDEFFNKSGIIDNKL